jgi:hypothetical protein
MKKLHNKDFSIAVRTGSDANKSKFAKEAVKGEAYYATDSHNLYFAQSTAGVSDALLSKLVPSTPYNLNLVSWYDASDLSSITSNIPSGTTDAIISQVNDKSGNGYHLNVLTSASTGPKTGIQTLNSLNVFSYDTSGQILENDNFSYDQNSDGLCMSVILKFDVDNAQDFVIAGTENTAAGTRMSVRRITGNNSLQVLGGSSAGSNIALGSGANTALEGQDLLFTIKFNGANSSMRIDGTEKSSGDIGTNPFVSLNIGGNEAETSTMDGYVAEFILFRDSNKQNEAEGYLAHKWGLTAKLPSNHPYKTTAP